VTVPEPGHGEVSIRVTATGVCHTDLVWAGGTFGPGFDFPVVLGHETAGVVEEVGPGVTRVRSGDPVVLSLAHHCGHCFYCESGSPMLCRQRTEGWNRVELRGNPIVQGFGVGGFSTRLVVQAISAIPLPAGVAPEVAAVAGCALATGFGAVTRIAKVEPGSTMAIIGCGGIGLSAVMASRIAGVVDIAVVDPNPDRLALARDLGATHAFDTVSGLLDSVPGDGFDTTLEAAGLVTTMEAAVQAARPGGTIVVVGAPPSDAMIRIPALDFVSTQKRLLGCITGDLRPNVDFARYFKLVQTGQLPLERLISHRLPLAQITEAFDLAARGDGIRTIVTMDAPT
jgi:S-(hydroxymethyl)glutathione dehydrogenase/alcohol dehydrogenase